jgi:hypothetical protein
MALTRASAAVIKTEELVNNRNLIINGDMQVAQRGTSVTGITTTEYYTADRWRLAVQSGGTWTMNVESSAPTNTEFRKSANVICTTAVTLGTANVALLNYRFEGQDLQGIKKGTSAAESLTVSFWVKSSNTGTYICELFENDNSRQISKSYTIDTANTWEKKTITFPPDTTGQLDSDNEFSLQLSLWLLAGTDYTSGTLNDTTWASLTNVNRIVGQLNLANAVGNYWAITGVQMEIGSTATPFERRPFGTELALCQRYYWRASLVGNQFDVLASAQTATQISVYTKYPVEMRAVPTVVASQALSLNRDFTATYTQSSLDFTGSSSTKNLNGYASNFSGLTAGIHYQVRGNVSNISFSAEL